MKIANIYAWCADKFRYYVVFSRAILFVSGLIISYRLVDTAVSNMLLIHVTREWKQYDLSKAAIIVNLFQGIYQVLQIICASVAHQYSGLFKMLICSTILYIIGLLLCFTASLGEEGQPKPGVFYTALVLLTLSQAAIKAAVPEFLTDQVMQKDPPTTNEEEERACSRAGFWWNSVVSLAALVSVFGLSNIVSFEKLAMVSAAAVGVCFLWFLLGIKYYKREVPTGCPLRDILFVIYTAIVRRRAPYPDNPIPPRVFWLRWLDKAAVAGEDEEQQPAPRNRFEQVKAVKFQLKMLHLWPTFLTLSLVAATGSTFFLVEAVTIKFNIRWLNITLQFFIVLVRFMRFIVAEVSDYFLQKCFKEKTVVQRMLLVRVGVGMMCCVLCCVAAWANSKKVRKNRADMSIFVLTPQFALLGFMEGFARDGLETLFKSQVSKSTSRQYRAPLGEFVMGYGYFVSVVCIVIFRGHPFGWLREDVPSSRLDKYYHFLMILSSANFVFYVFVAYWYGDETFLSEDPSVDAEGLRSSDQELGGSQSEDTSVDAKGVRSSDQELGGFQSEDPSVDAESLRSSGQELEDRRITSLH